ncbi:hypothetical protein OAA91_01710 [Fibrobacterales bacterium]|nr:hypothetical protein [Fibrobacterales bacterium]
MKIIIFFLTLGLIEINAKESFESKVLRSFNETTKISPTENKDSLTKYNEIMDDNWTLYSSNKSKSRIILTNKLKSEINLQNPNDLLILDLSSFIALTDSTNESDSILFQAFKKINYQEKIISYNAQQYFQLAIILSLKQIPKFLSQIDKAFLKASSTSFFIPQHISMVNAHSQRTHLYGAYGNEAIQHLLEILKSEQSVETRRSILSILRRICTEQCAEAISELLNVEVDHKSFVNGTYILLDNSGPIGKELYLKLLPKALPPKTQKYFESEKKYVSKISYTYLVNQLQKKFGDSQNDFSDEELMLELDLMIKNKGASYLIHPMDIINSSLPEKLLIQKLIESRRNSFQRINRHGLEDIDISNMIINTLQYKKQK